MWKCLTSYFARPSAKSGDDPRREPRQPGHAERFEDQAATAPPALDQARRRARCTGRPEVGVRASSGTRCPLLRRHAVDVCTSPDAARALQRRASASDAVEARELLPGARPTRTSGPAPCRRRSAVPGSPRPAAATSRASASAGTSRGATSTAASPTTSGMAPAVRGDHRDAEGHRFERRQSEALVERGVGEHACARDERRSCRRSIRCDGCGPRVGLPAMAAASASSPHPAGPAILRWTSGTESAIRSNAATRSGRPLRGSTVPMARM